MGTGYIKGRRNLDKWELGKIAGRFCKAFERAVMLTPTEENVRLWVEGTRMRPDEIEDSIEEVMSWHRHFRRLGIF